MISVNRLFEQVPEGEELDNIIKNYMGNLGKSLRDHADKDKTDAELLKDKVNKEKILNRFLNNKNKGDSI